MGPGSGSMPIRATLEHTLKFKDAGTLAGHRDVLQLSKSGERAMGQPDQAPSHATTSNRLLMNGICRRTSEPLTPLIPEF